MAQNLVEKRIKRAAKLVELAKEYAIENKRIIECNCHNYDSEKDLEKAFLAGRQSNSKFAAELEEMNAELEEMNADLKQSLDWANERENENVELIGKLKTANEQKAEQLAKAKEIIREMLRVLPKENIEGIYEITEEAEQFLF